MTGIYVHVPFCHGKCRYCSFVSTVNPARQHEYVMRVCDEIAAFGYGEKTDTVYFGGGTPSCLYPGAISTIFSKLRDKFVFDKNAEITCEANPESATPEFIEECLKNGVNRLSFGLQCADDDVLKTAGRLHSAGDFIRAVKLAKLCGINNISADFIIGLEGENRDILTKTLELIDLLDIPHVSAYSLSVEKGCVMYSGKYRPDEDLMADDYEYASDFLRNRGYDRYEISNFAKNGMISRHNTKYWTGADYIGFGPAAHSFYNDYRYANTDNIAAYLDGKNTVSREFIDKTQKREEFIMLRLRLKDGINLSEYSNLFGVELTTEKKPEVEKLLNMGVIDIKNNRLFATDKGIYVLNRIITELI